MGSFSVLVFDSLDGVLDCAFSAYEGREESVVKIMQSVNVVHYEDSNDSEHRAYALVYPLPDNPVVRHQHIPGHRWQYKARNIFVFTDSKVIEVKSSLVEIPSNVIADLLLDLKTCEVVATPRHAPAARFVKQFDRDRWNASLQFDVPYYEVNASQISHAVISRKTADFVAAMEDYNLFIDLNELRKFVTANTSAGADTK